MSVRKQKWGPLITQDSTFEKERDPWVQGLSGYKTRRLSFDK